MESESDSKRRRIQKPPPRRIPNSSHATDKEKNADTQSNSMVSRMSGSSLRIQQARIHAVAQAKQDGATGNFKVFDSQYGNYLIPVIPSHAELSACSSLVSFVDRSSRQIPGGISRALVEGSWRAVPGDRFPEAYPELWRAVIKDF